MIIDDLDAFVATQKKRTKSFWRNLWTQFRGQYIESTKLSHSFNLIMHTINTILVFLLFGGNQIGLWTAILFCINPVTNEGAIWLSGRPYSIATTLVLSCVLLIEMFQPLAIPIFAVFYYLLFQFSINGFLLPLLYIVFQPHWLVLFLPLYALLLKKNYIPTIKHRASTVTEEMRRIEVKKAILFFKTYAYYFFLTIFPFRVSMCHSYLHTYGLSEAETKPWYKLDRFFWAGVVLLSTLFFMAGAGAYYLILGWLWFTLFIVQWCNIYVINHPITERYAYLASIGLMYFITLIFIDTPIIWVFLAFYATRNFYVTPMYKDCKEFWKANSENFPNVAMAYNQYGLELSKRGRLGSAFDVWQDGLSHRPHDFRLNYNLANLLCGQKQLSVAKQYILKAEENLDKNNNYAFWKGNIDKMKDFCSSNGIDMGVKQEGVSDGTNLPGPPERGQEEGDKK